MPIVYCAQAAGGRRLAPSYIVGLRYVYQVIGGDEGVVQSGGEGGGRRRAAPCRTTITLGCLQHSGPSASAFAFASLVYREGLLTC